MTTPSSAQEYVYRLKTRKHITEFQDRLLSTLQKPGGSRVRKEVRPKTDHTCTRRSAERFSQLLSSSVRQGRQRLG